MTINFLVDECAQGPIARALADAGHDIAYVSAESVGASDVMVAGMAERQGRILLTQDYDFGELAVRRGIALPGVLLVGCDALRPQDRAPRVLAALAEVESSLVGYLTIIEPERVRRRRLG